MTASVQPLNGQKALVTGANTGIGAATARALASAGAAVVVNYVAHTELAPMTPIMSRVQPCSSMAA